MGLSSDLLFTCRILRKHPWTSLAVIAALLLGVGASTAVYAVINAVLLRPVPVFEPERVVRIYARVNTSGATMGISYPEYLDWKSQSRSFDAICVMRSFTFYSADPERPAHLKGAGISASGFNVFGVSVSRGRNFTEDDDQPGARKVAILNNRFWEQHFGSDPNAVGKVLLLDGQEFTIIGVLQTAHINVLDYPDVWVPNGEFVNARVMDRKVRPYFAAARLKAGVTPDQARTELETVASRLAAQYPASNAGIGIKFVGLTDLLTASDRQPVILLFIAAFVIFVLTCSNVVTTMVSWATRRRMELAIRMSLGASRFQVLRQLLLQSLLLVITGGALGLLCAGLLLRVFLYRFPNALIRFRETSIDYRVICFLILLVSIAAMVATLVPNRYASRLDIGSQLKIGHVHSVDAGYRRGRHIFLIAFQISVATSLALLSGLLIKSLYQVVRVDLGFTPHNVYSFQLNLPSHFSQSDQALFYMRALEKVSRAPGLSRSSAISSLPLTTQGSAVTLQTEMDTQGKNPLLVEDEAVLPGFFATLNIPIVRGREFTIADREGTPPVAIVDEVLAAKLWPDQTALGKRIRLVETTDSEAPWREIVGVVRQIRHFGPESKVRWMQVYVPEYQDPSPVMSFVIDTRLPAAAVKSAAERAVRELDRSVPVDNFQAMDDLLDNYLAGRKVTVLALSAFAGIAIVLAIMGIYSLVANDTINRRREIAIRVALGATLGRVLLIVIRRGLIAAVGGVLLACVIVASLGHITAAFLFDVTPVDSGVFSVTAACIFFLTIAAALVPTNVILRSE
jgi:predicted permease